MTKETDETWLTVQDVAERLKVDEETVRRWIRAGKLAVLDLGPRGGYRIRPDELAAFVAKRYGPIRKDREKGD